MPAGRKVTPRIEILKDGKVLNAFLLNRTRLVIGSAPGAHVRLRAKHIKPEHLVIELVNRRFLEAVNVAEDPHLRHEGVGFERVRLRKGSSITLGKLCFRLNFVDQDEETTDPDSLSDGESSIGTAPAQIGSSLSADPEPPDEPKPPEPPDAPGPRIQPEPKPEIPVASQPTAEPTADEPPPSAPVSAAALTEQLVFLLIYPPDGSKRKRVRLPIGTYDLGRKDCDINLHYPGLGDRHATLMVMPDSNVYVQSHLAESPVLVDGKPVQLSPVSAGVRFNIGPLAFELDVITVETVISPGTVQPISADGEAGGSAGAWVEAALRTDRTDSSPLTDPRLATKNATSLPIRRVSAAQSQPRIRIQTDPKVTAKEWVRQAIEDTGSKDREDVSPRDVAPAFPASAQAAAAPRAKTRSTKQRRPVEPQTGPEKAAAARFSQWATTTIPPEYRARKRRRALLSFLAVISIAGCAIGAIAWSKARGRDRTEPGFVIRGSQEAGSGGEDALTSADGSYAGLESLSEGKHPMLSGSTGRGAVEGTQRRVPTGTTTSSRSAGPTYGPAGSYTPGQYSGSLAEGEHLAQGTRSYGSSDPSLDPDIIRIGNPGPNAPILDFGSSQLGGTMVEDAETEYIRRVEELSFEMAEDTNSGTRGWVDMREVEAVLHSITPAARLCYSRVRETRPDLSGTMVLILTLSTSGQISAVSMDVTSSSLVDTDLKRCVERQIKSRNYPIPKGGTVTFSYPFRFNQ